MVGGKKIIMQLTQPEKSKTTCYKNAWVNAKVVDSVLFKGGGNIQSFWVQMRSNISSMYKYLQMHWHLDAFLRFRNVWWEEMDVSRMARERFHMLISRECYRENSWWWGTSIGVALKQTLMNCWLWTYERSNVLNKMKFSLSASDGPKLQTICLLALHSCDVKMNLPPNPKNNYPQKKKKNILHVSTDKNLIYLMPGTAEAWRGQQPFELHHGM